MGKLAQRLKDATRSGVYRTRQATEVEDAVRGTRLDLALVDLGGAHDKESLLERLALALGFPAWFGGNWDALEDCLGDLGWRAGDGHVFLFAGYENLPADDLGVLLDVLAASAAYWAERSKPFFAVFVDAGRTLALPELFRAKSA
ncbi:MAG TPA: barstar family protein [Burkholderiales bacterium]|nr:barstar family protein [Burkholderiales bacterium]